MSIQKRSRFLGRFKVHCEVEEVVTITYSLVIEIK